MGQQRGRDRDEHRQYRRPARRGRALGVGSVFVLDAVTFLVSAWVIASVERGFSAHLTGPAPGEAQPAPAERGGAGGGFMGVAAQSLLMRSTPDADRARTLGAVEACRNVAFGLGVVRGRRHRHGARHAPVAALVAALGGPRRLRPAVA